MKRKASSPGRKTRSTSARGRRPGRPATTHATVGREAIVAAARQVLDESTPHQATVTAIARKAGVDPALVRYYFKSREQLLLAVIEDILNSWNAGHPVPDGDAATRLTARVGNMLEFARGVRSMQRLMIDECAESRSPEVRRRVREINGTFVDSLAQLLQPGGKTAGNSTDPLFLYVAIVGLCEFFAAAQPMILPLAPAGMSPDTLADRYSEFIKTLVLDGLRKRIDPQA